MPTERELKEASRLMIVMINDRQCSMEKVLNDINSHLKELNHSVTKNKITLNAMAQTLYGEGDKEGLCHIVRTLIMRQWKIVVAISVLSASFGGGVAKIVDLLA